MLKYFALSTMITSLSAYLVTQSLGSMLDETLEYDCVFNPSYGPLVHSNIHLKQSASGYPFEVTHRYATIPAKTLRSSETLFRIALSRKLFLRRDYPIKIALFIETNSGNGESIETTSGDCDFIETTS